MIELLGKYENGNYEVKIYSDGTKVRETIDPNATEWIVNKPESIDIKITNQCDMMCEYCHENSLPDGLHGDIMNLKFIETLLPYSELAIGGGNPLAHPELIPFLRKLKSLNILANITVNQTHFEKDIAVIRQLVNEDLIKGLGVSLNNCIDEFIAMAQEFPNLVLHIINGIVKVEELKALAGKGLKVLILGYKEIRRGKDFYSAEVETAKRELYDFLPLMLNSFKVVSFDNLAITQLNVRRLLSQEVWDNFYMGGDGEFTMYIDTVKQEFAKSSTSPIRYSLMDNIEPMFSVVKRNEVEADYVNI